MMRDRVVLAIEGTHASGKTTLTHALAARYREHGIHVATVEEPARPQPVIRGDRPEDRLLTIALGWNSIELKVRAKSGNLMEGRTQQCG